MGCWRTELSSCCFTGFWKLNSAQTCRLAAGFWAVTRQIYDSIFPPNAIVSWMWCFNLSELRWHISNKWFLGAAIHTGSNSIVSLYLNDWFLDFRLSGYTSEGSCQLSRCMKLYYAAHLENVCTIFFNLQIKRTAKLAEREQRELKRSDIFSYCEIRYISPVGEKQLPVPFFGGSVSLCCLGRNKDCHTTRECKPGLLHKPNEHIRAGWKLWDLKTCCSVFTGKKTDFSWSHGRGLTQCFSPITRADL